MTRAPMLRELRGTSRPGGRRRNGAGATYRDFGTSAADRDGRRGRAGCSSDGRADRSSTTTSGTGSSSTPTATFDHLLIGSSLPLAARPGLHYLEAWNEAICDGALGPRLARSDRGAAAAGRSTWSTGRRFRIVVRCASPTCSQEVGAGQARKARLRRSAMLSAATSITPTWPRSRSRARLRCRSAVYQGVCSPMRNPLGNSEERAIRIAASRLGHAVGRGLARLAGVPEPRLRWRFVEGPLFDNQIATLKLRQKEAALRLDKTVSASDEFAFQRVFERRLAG